MYYLRSLKLCLLLLRLQRGLKSGYLVNSLGEFHGVPQKLGQHLTLYGGEASQALQSLCHRGGSEFGDIGGVLAGIGVSPLAAPRNVSQASIGQVFRVLTGEYGEIAVKLKYPDIEKKIVSDIKVMSAMAHVVKPFLASGSYLVDTLAFMAGRLLEECDYGEELRTQNMVSQAFAQDSHIHVPKTIAALCSEKVIVSEWMDGVFIHEALANAAADVRLKIYDLLWQFQLQLFWRLGMIHADPHQGNFLVSGTENRPELTVLDFGSKMVFNDRQRSSLAAILLGDCDCSGLVNHLRTLGFSDAVLAEYRPVLGDILTVMFEPFYAEEDYDFRSWRLAYKINTLLSSAVFRHPFTVPPVLLSFLRMMQGLYHYAQRYRIAYNWHSGIRRIAEKYN